MLPVEGLNLTNNKNVGGVESSRYFPERNNRGFMVKTMDAAVERFADNLKKIEQEKLMQAEDFKWRIQAEKEIIE